MGRNINVLTAPRQRHKFCPRKHCVRARYEWTSHLPFLAGEEILMEKTRIHRVVLMVVGLLLACTSASQAAPVTLTLTTTSSLTNVSDGAGIFQFDGGTVLFGSDVVGHFARMKRVVLGGGTDTQNTAMLTITIFFLGSDPPETVTLQGSHSFNNGQERGSISAASNAFAGAVGITFQGASSALTFNVP